MKNTCFFSCKRPEVSIGQRELVKKALFLIVTVSFLFSTKEGTFPYRLRNAYFWCAVGSVTQTYVDSLKKSGKFDQEAQLVALSLAKEEVLKELNQETKSFIETNYGSINDFVTTQIESTINLIKTKSV